MTTLAEATALLEREGYAVITAHQPTPTERAEREVEQLAWVLVSLERAIKQGGVLSETKRASLAAMTRRLERLL